MRRFASPFVAAALIAATLAAVIGDTSSGLMAGQTANAPVPAPSIRALPPAPVVDLYPAPDFLPPVLDDCDVPNRTDECGGQVYGPDDLVPTGVAEADDWRSLVGWYFDATDVDRAVAVLRCESGGDATAKNPYSTASGLFQHLGSLWDERAADAGRPGADIFDPVANVAVAAWLVYEGGGWGHWNPSRHCWR